MQSNNCAFPINTHVQLSNLRAEKVAGVRWKLQISSNATWNVH